MNDGNVTRNVTDNVTLAADFPPATTEQWRALVDKALKGAPFEKRLVTRLYEGIAIQPLYTKQDWEPAGDRPGYPGFAPFTRGGHASGTGADGWMVTTEHASHDIAGTNQAILTDLLRGATAIDLHFAQSYRPGVPVRTLDDLDALLKDVLTELVPVSLDAGHHGIEAAELLTQLWERRGVAAADAKGAFDIDPIGTLAVSGSLPVRIDDALSRTADFAKRTGNQYPNVTAVGVDSSPYYEAGATEAQDLAALMSTGVAYLKALTNSGMSIDAALGQLTFTVSVGCDQFLSIAKLRAARRLWARVAQACGASESARTMILRARTARRMMSQRDPWVNMLRTTVAGFAAGAGGADSVTILPFDALIGESDESARRIARNTQILLKEESYVSRVTDPAGGSWYVESLTDELAQAAWAAFQSIESRGGIVSVLRDGSFATEIATAWSEREKNIVRRKDPLTGTSEFPNLRETPLERRAAVTANASADSAIAVEKVTPLPQHRVHEEFESLRDASDKHKAAHGAWPTIFLANMGTVAQHTARSTFAKNFFEAGGIEAISNDGFLEAEAAAEAFRKSGATIAILCAVDALYESQSAAFASALKRAGATHLFQAGHPGTNKDAYEQAGVDEFIYIGVDVVSTLQSTLRRLGVAL
ncbi:MAG: methylmalonyl-CoA mutase family protein [Gemmatimonas sp.]